MNAASMSLQICIPRAGIVFGLSHSRRAGMMIGDEQVKLPQPGKASEVLTEHYRRAHPEALGLPSA
jgi:hypothetical protein